MHGEVSGVDSKAIAILIIGVGVIILIVSGAVGSPTDRTNAGFSARPVEARVLSISDVPSIVTDGVRRLPLIEQAPSPLDGRDIVCAVAIRLRLAAARPPDGSACEFTALGDGTLRCTGRFVHNCVGDFPQDDDPPEIQEARSRLVPAS